MIGGGVMGLGVAWRIARAGTRVRVLERGEVGREATWAAAGMLAPHAEIEFHEHELLRFAELSQQMWPRFAHDIEAAAGTSIGYDTTGTIVLALDRDDAEALERMRHYHASVGVTSEWLDGSGCRELEPLLSANATAGLLCPGDHQVDNRALAAALATVARDSGVEIRIGCAVAEVVIEAGAVTGVVLSEGERIDASRVVIAAGAWSRTLRGLGPHRPPVRPVKGQMLSLGFEPQSPPIRHVIRSPDAYLVPKSDGRLVVGASAEERGFERASRAGPVYELLKGAYEAVPATYELELQEMWTGFRPGSRDNLPVMGSCDIDGLFFATGHYRNGIQQSAATIELVSREVLGDTQRPLDPFRIQRFQSRRRT